MNICRRCNQSGKVMGLGNIMKVCPSCNGEGLIDNMKELEATKEVLGDAKAGRMSERRAPIGPNKRGNGSKLIEDNDKHT